MTTSTIILSASDLTVPAPCGFAGTPAAAARRAADGAQMGRRVWGLGVELGAGVAIALSSVAMHLLLVGGL